MIIDAIASIVTIVTIEATIDRFFRQVAGFDPAGDPEPYVYILLAPHRRLAWRVEAELGLREIMVEGRWVHDR